MTWQERCAEGDRIKKQIRDDLEANCGTAGNPKAEKLWELAWEYGHAYGKHEIASYYTDMAELIL